MQRGGGNFRCRVRARPPMIFAVRPRRSSSLWDTAMTQPSFATHEVFNQSPPFEDVDLYACDQPLVAAVAANCGAGAEQELSVFGGRWGSAAMAEQARLANENTPKLRTFDSKGHRRDVVEFHPAYHELMTHSAQAGLHNSTWTEDGKPR